MPQYIYKHPEENRYVEVTQRMIEDHVFFDHEGLQWQRVFTVPQAIISAGSEVNPFDIQKCVEKTGNMKGTVGDLWDFSREMSERRANKLGHEDPVKREYFNNYEKENQCKHFHDRGSLVVENENVRVDLSNPQELPKGGAFDLPVSPASDD